MSERITFSLDKLVRDKVYDDMVSMGQEIGGYTIDDDSKAHILLDKLTEELDELKSGDDDSPVDLASVLIAYAKTQGYTAGSLLEAVFELEGRRGAFDDGRFVDTITLKTDDPWVEYYRKDPERFKEISHDD